MNRLLQIIAILTLSFQIFGQGIEVKTPNSVICGAPSISTRPGIIDYNKVEKSTKEYKTIKEEGVKKGSARYAILQSKMKTRIKLATQFVAQDENVDCVVRKGEVRKSSYELKDLTDKVIEYLEDVNVTEVGSG